MPDLWLPGAEVHDLGDHAPTDQQYPPKAIAHITWDRNATAAAPQDWCTFDSLVSYFTNGGASAAPHIIWDPFSGRIAQLYPANSRSKSVVDSPGGTRTNRAGRVVIQVEAVFFPYCRYQGRVYPRLVDTPCAGWDRLHAWISSWGVSDVWPMGRPVDFTSRRNEQTWETRGGWYAHAHIPENDHQDPGSWPDFTTAPTPAPPPSEEDPLAAFTEADLRRFIREEVTSQQVRDTIAYAVDFRMGPQADARAAAAPGALLDAPMPDYALLPGGYRPTVGESINGAKTAGAQIAGLSAAVSALAQQVAAGGPVDVDALVARIEQAISSVTVHLTTTSKENS
ncbi:hypothetical protein P3T27_006486 [Kitasatospora sp. MAA19]|uniref:hypothetical protein n=1 Tax=Kitasatospora sp. MAA19 TaxID=3035090 RepID=UPI00247518D1|nr:hypothetical protein [Kitasatospora sp. MAA19]MDH6709737.1 hypothetical protein [Kitasatospora sp. MAA19]